MPLFRLAVAAASVASVLLVIAAPATASPAADTTPPSLVLEPYGRYVVGSTLNTTYDATDPQDVYLAWWDARYTIKWKASDASGICRQTLTEQSYDTLGGDPDPVLGDDTVTTVVPRTLRSHAYGTNLWDWERMGHSFVVRATDCAGNKSTSRVARTSFGLAEDQSSSIAYAGTWRTSNFAGFSGGTTHYSTTAGSSATVTAHGGPIALVMEKAANRGSADVYVDGVFKTAINTYSAKTVHRQIVWQALLADGVHTIKLVNRATAGHPRIDLDAVLL